MTDLTHPDNEKLRQQIAAFLTANLQIMQDDFKNLHPRYRVKLYCAMLQYELPRLKAIKTGIDFSQMTEVQLDYIIKELRESLTNTEETKNEPH